MKKFFTLIAAAMMALGVSAGNYTAPLTTTWSVQGGSNAAGAFTDAETHYYNMWGTSGWVAQAYTQFSLENIPEGEAVTKATYTVTLNSARGTNRHADVTVLPVGAKPADYQVLKAKADCGTQVAAYSDITTSYVTKTIDVTEQVKAALANGDSYIIMAISNGEAGGNIYGKAGATPPTLSISTVDASSMSGYIVKYMCDDTEIQKADTLPGVKGDNIALTSSQKESIYAADGLTKYIYTSDDASAFTVGEDTVTVTVMFKEAEVYIYKYSAKLDNTEYSLDEGTTFEGDAVTVYYPKYMLLEQEEGNKLYTSGSFPFSDTFTPTSANFEAYKEYTLAEENTNVIYYAEAEDIEGVNPYEDGNTDARMSSGLVGEADSVAVATLPAGKYTLTSSTRTGDTNFYVDGEKILTLSSTGSVTDATSPEFIVKKDGTEVMAKNVLTSNHKNYFDYVLIRKTGDYNYLYIEGELPDSITLEQGETPEIVNEISPKSNAPVMGPSALHVAQGSVEGTKETAEYTAIPATASEESVRAAFAEPGIYYVFASFVAQFADESIQFAYTDTVVVTVTEKVEPVVSAHTWDLTQWSEATITNLKAEAAKVTVTPQATEGVTRCTNNDATWSDHEKAPGKDCDTYAASKDNCFWFFGSANADGQLEANGQVIEELSGLTFDNATYNAGRSIAIAVNYGSTSLGTYAGGSYLWLGGSNGGFTIKNVKVGTTITMGVESHKLTPADPRGVKLSVNGTELTDPDGNDVAVPTEYAEQTWQVPYPASSLTAKGGALSADAGDEVVDVVVTNTKGCHIYFIDAEIGEVEDNPTAITAVETEAEAKTPAKFFENGQIIIVKDGKKYNAAGAQVK